MRAMYSIVSLSKWLDEKFSSPSCLCFPPVCFVFCLLALVPFGLETFLKWLATLACQLLFKSQGQNTDLEALRTYVELVGCELQYRMTSLEVC